MSKALTEFNGNVDDLIQDAAEVLKPGTINAMIWSALQKYSKDAPDEDVVEITGDGGQYYAITSLTNWSEGFSKIRAVEYPAATLASDEQPQMLESDDWAIFEDATAKYLYLPNHSPDATEKVRVWYTVPYTFSGSPEAVDLPVEDFYAVCLLAASYCCDVLSTYYATHVDVQDGRLAVKRDKVSDKYEARAQKYLGLYLKHKGLPLDGRPKAAGAIGEWDVKPSGSREYVFHPSWTR